MFKAVHINKCGKLLVDHAAYLRKHDVLYKTPAYEGYDGMPFGNGDIGGMLFNTRDSLRLVVNKVDTFDDRPPGNFGAWGWEDEEKNTALVSCGVLSISDTLPSFDRLYLKQYEQRMNLAEASIRVKSATPFSEYAVRIFASHKYNVIAMEVETSSAEEVERTVSLQRWGSRNFFHYYENFVDNPALKMDGTQSGHLGGCIYVRQKLSDLSFVIACKVIRSSTDVKIRNSRQADFILPASEKAAFILLLTVVKGVEAESLPGQAIEILKKAEDDYHEVYPEHQAAWRSFWEKSFIRIPDDYLENIYYLHHYLLNSSCRGGFPPSFTGSIWTWNHDIRNWGHFYHWNNQPQYWSVHASNHPELAENYYQYRFDMLDQAKRDAKEIFGVEGAWYSDIANRRGYQAVEPDTGMNLTCGPQIAMDFYRHFRYTQDAVFLRDRAYPVMKACADFYCGVLRKEKDGRYHISATAYEGYLCIRDTITDYAAIKALFQALLDATDILCIQNGSADLYREVLEMLYMIPLTNLTKDGEAIPMILSEGRKADGFSIRFSECQYPEAPFGGCELSPIFPSGIIGLKDSGTEIFEIARNTLRNRGLFNCCGHTPHPPVAARLGMAEELALILDFFIESFQCFPSGMFHYDNIRESYYGREHSYHPQVLTGKETHTDWENIHEKNHGNRIRYTRQDHIHMYMEALSNIAAGVNEMLLQSYDGVIRVFPAAPDKGDHVFSLQAEGGFSVTSEKRDAAVKYIHIHCLSGGVCRVFCPWQDIVEIRKNGFILEEFGLHQQIMTLNTQKDDTLLIYPKAYPIGVCYDNMISASPNNTVKSKGRARLGIERDF